MFTVLEATARSWAAHDLTSSGHWALSPTLSTRRHDRGRGCATARQAPTVSLTDYRSSTSARRSFGVMYGPTGVVRGGQTFEVGRRSWWWWCCLRAYARPVNVLPDETDSFGFRMLADRVPVQLLDKRVARPLHVLVGDHVRRRLINPCQTLLETFVARIVRRPRIIQLKWFKCCFIDDQNLLNSSWKYVFFCS